MFSVMQYFYRSFNLLRKLLSNLTPFPKKETLCYMIPKLYQKEYCF